VSVQELDWLYGLAGRKVTFENQDTGKGMEPDQGQWYQWEVKLLFCGRTILFAMGDEL
jgi:hypothetical protein